MTNTVVKQKQKNTFDRFNGIPDHHGLDRVNNSKGYTLDNVVSCCFECNRSKNSISLDWIASAYLKLKEHGFYESVRNN